MSRLSDIISGRPDAMFVAMQRYNRPRVLKLMEHSGKNNSKNADPNAGQP